MGTKDRLLQAATAEFAAKGFKNATVAAICRRAQANIAAVNYHFGGKKALYQETWRRAHRAMLEAWPPDGGVPASAPAEERLRGRVRAGLQRAVLGEAAEFQITRNEMVNPTGLLREVIDDAVGPLRQAMQAILRELLGPQATPLDIALCQVAIVAPFLHITRRSQAKKRQGLAPEFAESMLETMADRLGAFTLAGVRAVRRQIESEARRSPPPLPRRKSPGRRGQGR